MNKGKDECSKINSYHIGQHTGVAAFLLQIYIQSFWYVSIVMTVFNSWESEFELIEQFLNRINEILLIE